MVLKLINIHKEGFFLQKLPKFKTYLYVISRLCIIILMSSLVLSRVNVSFHNHTFINLYIDYIMLQEPAARILRYQAQLKKPSLFGRVEIKESSDP